MQQYFAQNKDLAISKQDEHHIKNVMRMKKGEVIKVVYNGNVNFCKITNLTGKVEYEVIKTEKEKQTDLNVTVAFSLIKEQKLNYLLQKSTEVGASCFIPFRSKRSIIKIDDEKRKDNKIQRWQTICKEASEQSGRLNVPVIMPIKSLSEIALLDYDVKLLCTLNKNSKNIKKVLPKINKCDKMLLVVGPEGGFDPKEEALLMQNGFISVCLGKNVLRAETAPVALISMINYEFMG